MVETDCDIHGTTDATVVCRHFAAAVLAGKTLPGPVVPLTFETDGEVWSVQICLACAQGWRFPMTGETLRGDGGLDRVSDLEWEEVCSRCFHSLRKA